MFNRPVFRSVLLSALATLLPFAAQAEDERVVNVYNWSDYIAEDTLERFTEETGIKVNYDVYDSNEIVEAKLMAGNSGYDVVFPSIVPNAARGIAAGLYQALDRAQLPNWDNIEPGVLKALAANDPGNEHAVPYMMAPTAYGVNKAKIAELAPDAPLDSWAVLFEPEWLEMLQGCGVTWLDDPSEVIAAAQAYLGNDPTTAETAKVEEAAALLEKGRPYLKYIHSSSYINDLANGDICVAHGYGGDLIQARDRAVEADKGVEIEIVLPTEGVNAVIDVMAIPADAPHVEEAHAFINFMLRPDVVGPITNEVGYTNAIKGSDEFVTEERLNDPIIYPSAETREKFFTVPVRSSSYLRSETRIWTRIKTGK